MKKITILLFAAILSFTALAQQTKKIEPVKRPDSVAMVQILMDTTDFKDITAMIPENIPGNTVTGKTVLKKIMTPLLRYRVVWVYKESPAPAQQQPATKPEEIKAKPKEVPKK